MKKIIVAIILLVAIIVLLFIWQKFFVTPNLSEDQRKQAIESILERKIRTPEDIPTGNKSYKGEYFGLVFPATAKIISKEKEGTASSRLEYLELKSYEPIFFTFVAQVFDTEGSLEEYSAVKFRREQAKLYTEESVETNQQSGIVFTNIKNKKEKTAFFLKKSKIYTFSMTGSTYKLNQTFDALIQSISFY